MTSRIEFIRGLPKAELHLHLEGSLEPEHMFALAKKNKVNIAFNSVEDVRSAYKFKNLQQFLDIYYQGMGVLQTEEDFHDLTLAYCRRAVADNTRHVEVFYDPQGHTERGIPFSTVTDGVLAGLKTAHSELGLSSKLIMCFLRHLSEENALATLKQAEPYFGQIVGIGLDSSELGHPPSKFKTVFKAAQDAGLRTVAHAGEEGPPEYVWEALDLLRIDRIDHGNRALEDPALVERIAADKKALTVCPLSNLKLCVVSDLKNHPLRRMLDAGLIAMINSDDPAYFGGYLNDNYIATAQALDLTKAELITLAKNSFIGSFLTDSEIKPYLAQIDAWEKVSG